MRKELLTWIEKIKKIIEKDDDTWKFYFDIVNCMEEYENSIKKDYEQENAYVQSEMYKYMDSSNVYVKIMLYSWLVQIDLSPKVLEEFINLILKEKELNYKNKMFLFYQIQGICFCNKCYETEEIVIAKWRLLEQIYCEIRKQMSMSIGRIPQNQLNENTALVITEQFLSTANGPTKIALDRCIVLKEELGKKVLLLNTAEIFSINGMLPFYNMKKGNYDETQLNREFQEWKNVRIPYIQCEHVLPEIGVYETLLKMVIQLKPATVINIGGSSIFAGLVNKMIPVLTVGTTQSGLNTAITDYQTYEGKIDEKWKSILVSMNRSEEHVIEGRFTFAINEQKESVTRSQFGIPEGQFVCLVVGYRLDDEVTEEFLNEIVPILDENIGIAFLGNFNRFESYREKYPEVAQYMYAISTCKDILSRMEICDLYVNPLRKGGGTSVVEMMSKKKPAISVAFGDVAGIIGEEFCCRDYAEMVELIKRYATDKEFYTQKSELALKVAEECLDSKNEFVRILKEYEKRKNQK